MPVSSLNPGTVFKCPGFNSSHTPAPANKVKHLVERFLNILSYFFSLFPLLTIWSNNISKY